LSEIIKEVADKHGVAALLQEKPFNDVNGFGKHNNWSLATRNGINLLEPDELAAAAKNDTAFPVVIATIVSAV
jgi:glutamine synthetase